MKILIIFSVILTLYTVQCATDCKNDESKRANKILEVFDITGCNNEKIFYKNFTSENKKIKQLLADQNQITQLESNDLKYVPFLMKIVLSNNLISKIAADAFKSNRKLVEVDLAHNQIVVLESYLFNDLRALKSIDLSNNKINQIQVDAFLMLPILETLNLKSNECINEMKTFKNKKAEDDGEEDIQDENRINLSMYFFEKTTCTKNIYCNK